MAVLSGVVERNGVRVEGAKITIIDADSDTVVATAESDVDGAWSQGGLDDKVEGVDLGYDVHCRYEDGGVLYRSLPDIGIVPVADPFGDLLSVADTEFALFAALVAEGRSMAAADMQAFDVETESSANGYRVDQPTGGDRPTIRTDTGASGGYWLIRFANDFLRVRDAANTTNILGSDLMPTEGTMYGVARIDGGAENSANAVVAGCQTVSGGFKGIDVSADNDLRFHCGGGGGAVYVVVGSEPTAALEGFVCKWDATTFSARTLSGSWASSSTGSGADIAAALAEAFLIGKGASGTADDMDLCILGVISRKLTDAQVDDADALADMVQAAWDASVAA